MVDSTLVAHAGEMGHAQIVNATKGLSVKTFRNVTELLFHPANFQPVRNRGNWKKNKKMWSKNNSLHGKKRDCNFSLSKHDCRNLA